MTQGKVGTGSSNALTALGSLGQSVWLDFILRSFIAEGDLKKLVDAGLGGVTSNPAIFEKAIGGSEDYLPTILQLAKDPTLPPKRVFELLAVKDIQDAADVLKPVYDRTETRDGYVSLEVAPDLAKDAERTLEEARRLWTEVNRPNLMVKVPATREGIVAFRQLISEGINVNVTLLFAREMYEAVARAYIEGLQMRVAAGKPIASVASVASFFVSRIDSSVDSAIDAKKKIANDAEKARLDKLAGKVAVANAKLAYQSYKTLFSGAAWADLLKAGAQPQRVLWASTGTKNPKYRDVLYIEELIGPETVNTVPPETLAAFREHGVVKSTLESDLEGARRTLDELEQAGISLSKITADLLTDGLEKFVAPFHKLLSTVERRFGEAVANGKRS